MDSKDKKDGVPGAAAQTTEAQARRRYGKEIQMDSKDKKDGVPGAAAQTTEAQVPADVAAAVAAMLAEAQAKSQAMVDDAAAKAQKLIADAEAGIAQRLADAATMAETQAAAHVPRQGAVDSDPAAKKRAKRLAYLNEKVPIRLMKDSGRYKDDVFVAVNGKGYLIKRGQKVMVPRFVAIALDNAQAQDEHTDMLIAGEAEKFSRVAREM